MKKQIIATAIAMASLSLASCGNSVKGVMGKTFTFDSCTAATLKSGTEESSIYNSTNPAGATKEAVVTTISNAFYRRGTADRGTTLEFSTELDVTGSTFNGEAATCYKVNYTKINEYTITNECSYILLNKKGTSLHFVNYNTNTSVYEKYTFQTGSQYSSENGNVTSYKTYFTETSCDYDESGKKLTIAVDFTFESNSDTYGANYTLVFNQK